MRFTVTADFCQREAPKTSWCKRPHDACCLHLLTVAEDREAEPQEVHADDRIVSYLQMRNREVVLDANGPGGDRVDVADCGPFPIGELGLFFEAFYRRYVVMSISCACVR